MLLFRKIVTAQYAMEGNLWESVSSEAKDLVRNLLQIDVEARYTTDQVLESAFSKGTTPFKTTKLSWNKAFNHLYIGRGKNIATFSHIHINVHKY